MWSERFDGGFTLVPDQLELALDDVRRRVPWEGQSPRGLTRGAGVLYSRRKPGRSTCALELGQMDLFCESVIERPPVGGESLLIEPEVRDG